MAAAETGRVISSEDSTCSYKVISGSGVGKVYTVFVTELSCGSRAAPEWAFYSQGAAPIAGTRIYGAAGNRSQVKKLANGCTFSGIVTWTSANESAPLPSWAVPALTHLMEVAE